MGIGHGGWPYTSHRKQLAGGAMVVNCSSSSSLSLWPIFYLCYLISSTQKIKRQPPLLILYPVYFGLLLSSSSMIWFKESWEADLVKQSFGFPKDVLLSLNLAQVFLAVPGSLLRRPFLGNGMEGLGPGEKRPAAITGLALLTLYIVLLLCPWYPEYYGPLTGSSKATDTKASPVWIWVPVVTGRHRTLLGRALHSWLQQKPLGFTFCRDSPNRCTWELSLSYNVKFSPQLLLLRNLS